MDDTQKDKIEEQNNNQTIGELENLTDQSTEEVQAEEVSTEEQSSANEESAAEETSIEESSVSSDNSDASDSPATEEVSENSDQSDSSDKSDQPETSEAAEDSDSSEQSDASDSSDQSESSESSETEEAQTESTGETTEASEPSDDSDTSDQSEDTDFTPQQNPNAKWYVVHTFSGHENKVLQNLTQKIETEHFEDKILQILVPTQEKIEIRGGKKEQVKEKIFPGYILVRMELDDNTWLAVRTTPGVTSFVGIGNKPTPIPESEVKSIMQYMTQGAAPTFKDVFMVDDTVKIVDGPFSEFIGKVDTVDKEKGKVRVLVSIFGRETPVELDFLQVTKL